MTWLKYGPLVLTCLYIIFAPTWPAIPIQYQYDDARATQLFLLGSAILLYLLNLVNSPQQNSLPAMTLTPTRTILPALAVIALLSTILSPFPLIAIVEPALFWLLATFAASIFSAALHLRQRADQLLVCATMLCIPVFGFAFFSGVVESAGNGTVFEWISPFVSFGNVRFFSQFQAYTLPLLAIPLIGLDLPKPWRVGVALMGAFWWSLQFAVATRTIWLAAVAVVIFLLIFLRQESRRFLLAQAAMLLCAGLIYLAYIFAFPDMPGFGRVQQSGLDSSARLPLWLQAISMIGQSPLLGRGPMGFAFIDSDIPAHPHNSLLQIAGEYGLIAALLLCILIFAGVKQALAFCRAGQSDDKQVNISLLAALLMGLFASLLDGNILMPHSQIMLAVVVGWLYGRNSSPLVSGAEKTGRDRRLVVIVSVSLMSAAMVYYYTQEYFSQTQPKSGKYQTVAHPRIWMNGKYPVQ